MPAALLIFFLSGFAALLYQVVWQRLLVIFSGADVYSVTIIVAAFMAGLGAGNLSGGYLADRLSTRANLWLFAAAECAIGAFGLLSKPLYYDVLYERLPSLAAFPGVALVLLVSLLWPTFFMGLSLPLLAKALTRTLSTAGRVVGSLYGWNTLGAATGALATTWWLMPRVGMEDALRVGAAINLACALGAAGLAWWLRPATGAAFAAPLPSSDTPRPRGIETTPSALSFRAWACVYAATGFSALALEIIWFRVLGVALKSTAFTFGTLMAVFLTGLGAGAVLGARFVAHSRRPGVTFLALQAVLIVIAAGSVTAFVMLLESGRPASLAAFVAGGEPYDVYGGVGAIREIVAGRSTTGEWAMLRAFLSMYGGLPIALIGVPTFLMGFSFPYLQKATQVDYARLGQRVGLLMTSNIVGSALGAMAAGWVLLPLLGTPAALRIVTAMGGVLAVLMVVHLARDGRRGVAGWAGAGVIALVAAMIAMVPDSARFWAALHGTSRDLVLVAEDGSGVSLLKSEGPALAGQTLVYVNGLGQSWIPYGNIHTVLGVLPLLLHPNPEEIALIGLGSGDTAFAAAGRPDVRSVVCIEIMGAQRRTLEEYAAATQDPGVVALLSDPRIELRVGDGRAYLAHSGRRFDAIEADALRPSTAYSGNLYSREYFELVRSRLKPGGLAVTWAPSDRVRATFVSVFPHVLALGRDILVGSDAPIVFDRTAIDARITSDAMRAYYRRAGANVEDALEEYLDAVVVIGPDHDRTALQDLNSDLFPRDEYNLPRVLPF